jgi:hypothetical protein
MYAHCLIILSALVLGGASGLAVVVESGVSGGPAASAVKRGGDSRHIERLDEYERLLEVLEARSPDLLQQFVVLSQHKIWGAKVGVREKKMLQVFLKTVAVDGDLTRHDKKAIQQFFKRGLSTGAKIGVAAAAVLVALAVIAARNGISRVIHNALGAAGNAGVPPATSPRLGGSASAVVGSNRNEVSRPQELSRAEPLVVAVHTGNAMTTPPDMARMAGAGSSVRGNGLPLLSGGGVRGDEIGTAGNNVGMAGAGTGVGAPEGESFLPRFTITPRAAWGMVEQADGLVGMRSSSYLIDATYDGITTDEDWTTFNGMSSDRPNFEIWTQRDSPPSAQDFLASGNQNWTAQFRSTEFREKKLTLFGKLYVSLARMVGLPKVTGVCALRTNGSEMTMIVRTNDGRYFAFLCDGMKQNNKIYQIKMSALVGMLVKESANHMLWCINDPGVISRYFKDDVETIKKITEELSRVGDASKYLDNIKTALHEVIRVVNDISIQCNPIDPLVEGESGFRYSLDYQPSELVVAITELFHVLAAWKGSKIDVSHDFFMDFHSSLIKFIFLQYCVKNNLSSLDINSSDDALKVPKFFTPDFFERHSVVSAMAFESTTFSSEIAGIYRAAVLSARKYTQDFARLFEMEIDNELSRFFDKLYPISA